MNLPYPDPWEQELKKAKERIEKFKPKPKTYHEGANDERSAILAKVRRMKKSPQVTDLRESLPVLEAWLLHRNERYRKNPGGL